MLCKQPANEVQAFVAYSLVLAQRLALSPLLAVLTHILAAHCLASFRMYALLHTVILRLVRHRKHLRPYQVSILLRVLTDAEPHEEVQRVIVPLLRVAIREKMVLGAGIYRALLDNTAAPLIVAQLVETHMSRLGYNPNLAHSRAFVRIYGEGGQTQRAARHWRRIRHGEVFGKVPQYAKSADYQTAQHAPPDALGDLAAKPALPTPDDIPPDVWLRVLSVAAADPEVPVPNILALLEQGRSIIQNPAKSLAATTTVIKGLLRRQALEEAAPLVAAALQHKRFFDPAQLTIAAEALTLLGRPAAAFRLLREQPAKVDTRAVNAFMIALVRTGRPDAVFYLWDTLPRVFAGVQPSSATLAILLKAARVARKCEGALQVALQDFGLRRILPAGKPERLDERQAVEGLERLLERKEGRAVTGFWRGERAGAVALRVAWKIFTSNWPALADLTAQTGPPRQSAEEHALALSPIADLYRSLHDDADTDADGADDGRTYYGIVPHDPAFRALLDLLAEEGRARQVPLVLAWMRYLGVRPSKDTLAAALVYWGEVALEGPLIERWRGARGSEYGRLVAWVEEWVGRRGMPGREESQRALRRVRWGRESGAYGLVERQGDEEFSEEFGDEED
ncbi:uncharacterized protein TRAVEDRAFT_128552 [Trametes versicolor FP-101664 SS1]|uniref:uncharacterized protein n=1 Tax=Trametes versicolor (strain FP-101664) TaxID=717944 RepID=UPI0004623ED7|nr:uncharacterized protein TRAVEDRAFT_128552 [Trametes versicolor FP-101664 SS1]EIW56615.1 hypothetical protein TRAVEDRAFT_128552 [Trametes versicolor FP-101664 SS1]